MKEYSARDLFWMLLNGTLVLVMLFGMIGIGTMIKYSNAIIPARTITVSAEGKVKTAPDIATYSFSVVSRGKNLNAIKDENATKMNTAVAFVKAQGVLPADIQTTAYNPSLIYAYDRNTGKQTVDGYELNQSVTIKIRNLATAGAILNGLIESGVNQAGGLQYAVENPEVQRAEAREEAFTAAYTKARQMAAQNGVRIAKVVNFSEYSNSNGPIYYAKDQAMAAGMASAVPAPESGTEEIVVNVSVTYEIR